MKRLTHMGHEYCGGDEEVGCAAKSVRRGRFVAGSFFASDNTCAHRSHGYQTSCANKVGVSGAQAPLLRVPLADGTLVATPEMSDAAMVPSLLAVSDVLGTGWLAADARASGRAPPSTVMSFTAARRTREIGIRVALGASRRRVVAAVFARPLAQVGLGIVAGAVLTAIVNDGVEHPTPGVLAGALVYAVLMLGVCLLACVVPTRRALKVQPTEALRADG